MKKIFDFFYDVKLEWAIASAFTLLMIGIMCLNVFMRYTFNFAFGWGDEVVRYLNLYAAFFGISAGMNVGVHIGITALIDFAIPRAAKKYFRLFAELITLAFCLVIVYFGFILTAKQFGMNQISPALQVPMFVMYAAIPLGMVLTSIQCIIKIFYKKDWKNLDTEQIVI